MKYIVVLFAVCAVACGSLVAQPSQHPAIVLDAVGRPLDTAEVINSRALHLQAQALEGHYGHAAYAPYSSTLALAPAFGYGYNSALGYAGHHLYKRSLAPGYHPAVIPFTSAAGVTTGVGQHGGLTHINHAAAAPIATADPYNYGHGYQNSASWAHPDED